MGKNSNLSFFVKMIQLSEPKSWLRKTYVKQIWEVLRGTAYNEELDNDKKKIYKELEEVEVHFPSEKKKVENMLKEIIG